MTKNSLYEDLVLQLQAEGDAFIVTREWLVEIQHQLSFRQNVASPLMLPELIDDYELDELDIIIHTDPAETIAVATQKLIDWYNAVKEISEPVDITTSAFAMNNNEVCSYNIMLNGCKSPFFIERKGRHWGVYHAKHNKAMLVQAHSIQDIIAKLAILWNSKI